MKVLQIIFVALVILGFLWLFKIGIDRNEKVECRQWKLQEANYPLFYATQWQKEQCKQYGVEFVDSKPSNY